MKILQLSARLPYPLSDGGAIGIYNIARALAREGHDVTFVSFPLESEETTQAAIRSMSQFCRVELVDRPLPSRRRTLIRTLFRGAYPVERRMMPEMFALLKKLLDREAFDLVHLDHSHVGKYGLWIKERYGVPVVLREHNFETLIYERFAMHERNPLKRFVARVHAKRLRRVEVEILNGVDSVAAITEEDVRLMREAAPQANYYVIPAGVDLDYFVPSDPRLIEPNSILWVGGLDWDPNRDAFNYFAREILPAIASSVPNVKFCAVGRGTESVDRSVLTSAGVKAPELMGLVEDVRPFFAKAAVLIVPLRIGGGMRLKLLEFFAASKAVISTPIGAEGNKARDGIEVILRENPLDFAEAVIKLLADPTTRTQLGIAARSFVELNYSWESVGRAFSAMDQETVRRKLGHQTTSKAV